MFSHAVRNFVNQITFSSKHVSTFLPQKCDAISQLRHSYAKDSFCVMRLSQVKKLYSIILFQHDIIIATRMCDVWGGGVTRRELECLHSWQCFVTHGSCCVSAVQCQARPSLPSACIEGMQKFLCANQSLSQRSFRCFNI